SDRSVAASTGIVGGRTLPTPEGFSAAGIPADVARAATGEGSRGKQILRSDYPVIAGIYGYRSMASGHDQMATKGLADCFAHSSFLAPLPSAFPSHLAAALESTFDVVRSKYPVSTGLGLGISIALLDNWNHTLAGDKCIAASAVRRVVFAGRDRRPGDIRALACRSATAASRH